MMEPELWVRCPKCGGVRGGCSFCDDGIMPVLFDEAVERMLANRIAWYGHPNDEIGGIWREDCRRELRAAIGGET